MKNRDYQTHSIDSIRNEFLNGHLRVLLWLSTGGGKTYIFCLMVKEAARRGKKCIIVVRGRKLVDQASRRLFREKVDHGVLMNNHWNYRPNLPVQVCSIDTMIARNLHPEADLLVIDEAHLFDPDAKATEWLNHYKGKFWIPVTATPYLHKGLRHLADVIVHPISMNGLISLGYLVPFRYFSPAKPDLTNVEISATTHDYKADQLEVAMNAGTLTGKIIEHWKKIAFNLPTICFAVNIHHSKLLTERFKSEGISAEHCDSDTSDEDRAAIISRLESGETKIICNVGILCTGVDIPCLRAIIMARPTKSLNLFIQQAGRGTRPFESKESCVILDHAGNIGQHGFPTDEPEAHLDGIPNLTHKKKTKICDQCYANYRGSTCEECGFVKPAQLDASGKEIIESEYELVEIQERNPVLKAHKEFLKEAKRKGRRPSWAHYELIKKFGLELAKPYLSLAFIDKYIAKKENPFKESRFKGISFPS